MTRKIHFHRQPQREIYWQAVRNHYNNFLRTNTMISIYIHFTNELQDFEVAEIDSLGYEVEKDPTTGDDFIDPSIEYSVDGEDCDYTEESAQKEAQAIIDEIRAIGVNAFIVKD